MVVGFPPSAPGLTPGWRVWSLRLVAATLVLCAMAGWAGASERPSTYAVKAAYLYKFTPFVEWPASAFRGAASPFRLCIGGRDPFRGLMDRAARGRRVGDHPMVVVRLPIVTKGASDCHLLFLAPSRAQTPQQMLAAVAGQPVLTVADEALDASGAMVQFVALDRRVRFEIRSDAVQASGLVLSSKLMALSAPPREGGR